MILSRIQNRKGASLIEIMTTLVVLTLGILVVSRMYSGGFRVVKRAENNTVAQRLAEKELERLKGRSETLPLGITTAATNPPAGGGMVTHAASENVRQIVGETVRIPAPIVEFGANNAVVGSMHELTFGPIESVDSIYSARMQRRTLDSSDTNREPWEWLRSTQYGIDYEEAKIVFEEESYPRTFSLSYSYWVERDDRSYLMTAVGVELVVPPGAQWLDIPTMAGGPLSSSPDYVAMDGGSDRVARAFAQLGVNAEWSNRNPYEYKVVDGLTGRLAFNPRGYTYKERTPEGVMDLTAHVDYTVYDWAILQERVTVSNTAPFTVRTTVGNLKQRGITINDDGSVYPGLTPDMTQDLLIVDEATGEHIPQGVLEAVDYRSGRIEFPSTVTVMGYAVPSSGRVMRIYYRAEGDWQMQVRKAYERYTPQNQPTVSFREYFNDGTDIILNLSEIGKTFSVDYYGRDLLGIERLYHGEVVRAEPAAGGGAAVLHLSHPLIDVRAVRGLSVNVVVLWSEQSTRDSGGNLVPRFQNYSLEGVVTRGQIRG